jgi:RNA polymerase sigma factor (sigma-70 family)
MPPLAATIGVVENFTVDGSSLDLGRPNRARRGKTMASGLMIETKRRRDRRQEALASSKPRIDRPRVPPGAQEVLAATIEPVHHPSYEQPEAGRALFARELRVDPAAHADGLNWLTPRLARVVASSLTGETLPHDEETRLFRQMNFCRCQILRLGVVMSRGCLRRDRALRQMTLLHRIALKVRERIVEGNLGLVISTARRLDIGVVPFADLVSEGNLALLRAVDRFDVSRGFRFSTYACRAIQHAMQRLAERTQRHRNRFPVSCDPDRDGGEGTWPVREAAATVGLVREALGSEGAGLTRRERRVLKERFGIGPTAEPSTLREVGARIGVGEERARQIQNCALAKLRDAMADHPAR